MLRNGATAQLESKAHRIESAPYAGDKAKAAKAHFSIPYTELEPIEDLLAEGKALRQKVPRKAHAKWKASERRTTPLQILHASDASRLRELIPIRYGRMLQSPFAFYRGSAGVMAADLAMTPTTDFRVQAC